MKPKPIALVVAILLCATFASAASFQITYPTIGDNVAGVINIIWSSTDVSPSANVKIILETGTQVVLAESTPNDGEFSWDTRTIPNGAYFLTIQTVDGSVKQTGGLFRVLNSETSTPPSSSASSPTHANGATIPVSFSASAGSSAVASVRLYSNKDGGSFTDTGLTSASTSGTFSFTPSGDGTYGFYTRATDTQGNTESAPSSADDTTIYDTTDPVTTLGAGEPSDLVDGQTQVNASTSFSLSASDGGSGVASTFFSVDGASQQTYSAAFSLSGEGNHSITYWSVDAAGNEESQHTEVFLLVGPAPVDEEPEEQPEEPEVPQEPEVPADTTAPSFTGARAVTSTLVILTFSEDLNGASLGSGEFAVERTPGGERVTISAITENNGEVNLTLSSPLGADDNPQAVTHPGESSGIRDGAGNAAAMNVSRDIEDDIPPAFTLRTVYLLQAGQEHNFSAQASDVFSGIASVSWDFGDGTTHTTGNATHTYASEGTYTIELTVTDGAGNSATKTAQALVGVRTVALAHAPSLVLAFESMPNGSFSLDVAESGETDAGTSAFNVGGKFLSVNSTLPNGQFRVNLTFNYTDANNDSVIDGTSINEGELNVYFFNGDTWALIENPVRDANANTITVEVDHFTTFGLFTPRPAPASTTSTSGSSGGGGGGGGCVPRYSEWSACSNGRQTRTVTNNCFARSSSLERSCTSVTTFTAPAREEEPVAAVQPAPEPVVRQTVTEEPEASGPTGITGRVVDNLRKPSVWGAILVIGGVAALGVVGYRRYRGM